MPWNPLPMEEDSDLVGEADVHRTNFFFPQSTLTVISIVKKEKKKFLY